MLARTLGRTVDELGQTMTADEFADHYQDWCYDPWGDRRLDWHFARMNQAIMNYAGKMLKEPIEDASKLLLQFRDRNDESQSDPEPDPAAFFSQFMK